MFLLKSYAMGNAAFIILQNVQQIFVLKLREKGGLNQIILRYRCFLLLSLIFVFGMKTKGSLNPLFLNASHNILVLPSEKSLY